VRRSFATQAFALVAPREQGASGRTRRIEQKGSHPLLIRDPISQAGTQSYTYDEVNRLKTAQEGSGQNYWKQEFDYDRFGNRRFNAATTSNVLGPNPQIDEATNRFLQSEGYVYDEAGNLRQEPGKSYKYDAESRLTEFNSGSATYSYDGDGRRVRKAVGTDVTVFVYNIAGQLVAEYRNTPVELGGGTSFVTTDHLGSIRFITHRNGDIKSRHDYLPFGEELTIGRINHPGQPYYNQPDGLNQKFTGKERDAESGLDYFGARYYSSSTGRFTSADSYTGSPQMPQTFNLYAYTINNPLRYTDPTGNFIVSKSPFDGMDDPLDQAVGDEGGSPIVDALIESMAEATEPQQQLGVKTEVTKQQNLNGRPLTYPSGATSETNFYGFGVGVTYTIVDAKSGKPVPTAGMKLSEDVVINNYTPEESKPLVEGMVKKVENVEPAKDGKFYDAIGPLFEKRSDYMTFIRFPSFEANYTQTLTVTTPKGEKIVVGKNQIRLTNYGVEVKPLPAKRK
jgi:RHS repeat-associated protein